MRHLYRFLAASALITTLASISHAGTLVGIDGMTSTVMQRGQSSFSGVGLRARIHADRVIPAVELMPNVEYWRISSTVAPYGIKTARKDATLGIDARYKFNVKGWQPYAGAGFGLHFLSTSVQAPSLGLIDAHDSVIKGGLAALGGFTFGLSTRLDNFFEVKYAHVTDNRQLKINWGLAYRL